MKRQMRWLSWVVCGLSAISLAGCKLISPATEPTSVGTTTASKDSINLLYRIDSDRLNLSNNQTAQLVSFQPQPMLLPSTTLGTLTIDYPHPKGIPDYALARVAFRPRGEHTTKSSRSIVDRITFQETKAVEKSEPLEVWEMDVPKWRIDAVVTKLKQENFFRRSRLLDANVYLAARVNEQALGKDYRAVPELDALLLQCRTHGRLVKGAPEQLAQRPVGPQPNQPVNPTFVPTVQQPVNPGVIQTPQGPIQVSSLSPELQQAIQQQQAAQQQALQQQQAAQQQIIQQTQDWQQRAMQQFQPQPAPQTQPAPQPQQTVAPQFAPPLPQQPYWPSVPTP